jgi:prepilin-type N-terminal cleavage/methylation domain-containing protein
VNKRSARGFTLIELITVMAISAILFGIIVIPVYQGFNLTRSAQSFADAQERARLLIDRIVRDIGNSAAVRDNSGPRGSLILPLPGRDGNPVGVRFENVKLDLLAPSAGETAPGPTGALRNPNSLIDPAGDPSDPNNWREDPTLRTPIGQPNLPASPGLRMVRYFIGLRQPVDEAGRPVPYNNPHDGLLMARSSARDNLFVLYRAEVDLRLWNRAARTWQLNTELFDDADGDGQPDNVDDPAFFLPYDAVLQADGTYALTPNPARADRIRAWLRRSRVVTELARFDLIAPEYNRTTRAVTFDGNAPRVTPLIQFRPQRVTSEPAEGMVALRGGEETDSPEKVAPDVFRTEFGGWTSTFVRLWPSVYVPGTTRPWEPFAPWSATLPDGSAAPYLTIRARAGAGGQPVGTSVFLFPGAGDEARLGRELFDLSAYAFAAQYDPMAPLPPGETNVFRYPFSYALQQALSRDNWMAEPEVRALFIPAVPDSRQGKIRASFAITEVGDGDPMPAPNEDNRPVVATGPAFVPPADNTLPPGAPTGRFQHPALAPSSPVSTINQRFNALWNDWPALMQATTGNPGTFDPTQLVRRFVDLRFAPNFDGSPSPLHPAFGFARARIVPGSEVVMGPDQVPGPNYGRLTRYSRVSAGAPGPNQYRINYNFRREPDWARLGFTVPPNVHDPAYYDPASLVSAILQPAFRPGYLEFNSRFGEPLPNGQIFVFYRFQFTEPNDVIAVDYDTRQTIDVNLSLRVFPQIAAPEPQRVTVKGTATVRNFLR